MNKRKTSHKLCNQIASPQSESIGVVSRYQTERKFYHTASIHLPSHRNAFFCGFWVFGMLWNPCHTAGRWGPCCPVAGGGLGDWGEAFEREKVVHANPCWWIKVKVMDMFGRHCNSHVKKALNKLAHPYAMGEDYLLEAFLMWEFLCVDCANMFKVF